MAWAFERSAFQGNAFLAEVPVLAPARFNNAQNFFSATVNRGAVTLAPTRFDNAPAFYTHTLNRGAVTLSPSRYDATQSFYSPTLSATLTLSQSARFTNSQSFYAATLQASSTLTPARLDNSPTWYAHTLSAGPVSMTASLYNNAQTFYTATASPGPVALAPSRFDNAPVFYAHTLAPGAVSVSPTRYDNAANFYAHALSNLQQRYARPEADVSPGAWTPSSGTDLYPMVDEDTASDTDYIETSSASACTLRLQAVRDPQSTIGQVVKFRARSSLGSTLIARLKQGSTTIASVTETNVPSAWTDFSLVLSAAECDAITDYTDLRVELEAA